MSTNNFDLTGLSSEAAEFLQMMVSNLEEHDFLLPDLSYEYDRNLPLAENLAEMLTDDADDAMYIVYGGEIYDAYRSLSYSQGGDDADLLELLTPEEDEDCSFLETAVDMNGQETVDTIVSTLGWINEIQDWLDSMENQGRLNAYFADLKLPKALP